MINNNDNDGDNNDNDNATTTIAATKLFLLHKIKEWCW